MFGIRRRRSRSCHVTSLPTAAPRWSVWAPAREGRVTPSACRATPRVNGDRPAGPPIAARPEGDALATSTRRPSNRLRSLIQLQEPLSSVTTFNCLPTSARRPRGTGLPKVTDIGMPTHAVCPSAMLTCAPPSRCGVAGPDAGAEGSAVAVAVGRAWPPLPPRPPHRTGPSVRSPQASPAHTRPRPPERAAASAPGSAGHRVHPAMCFDVWRTGPVRTEKTAGLHGTPGIPANS